MQQLFIQLAELQVDELVIVPFFSFWLQASRLYDLWLEIDSANLYLNIALGTLIFPFPPSIAWEPKLPQVWSTW